MINSKLLITAIFVLVSFAMLFVSLKNRKRVLMERKESEVELYRAIYKKAWFDGAHATIGHINEYGRFDQKAGETIFYFDSLEVENIFSKWDE